MEPIIIDTDPGIDDALAIMLAYLSPKVDVRAITLVHGNVGIQAIQKNAVVILNALAEHSFKNQTNRVPVLAVGASSPLQTQPPDATYFHGNDGLGMIYDQLYPAPEDWEQQLNFIDDNEKQHQARGFVPTSRDAADEILYQLSHLDPLTCTIIALGPLTNLAIAYQRDPVTFSRAQHIVIMGGAIHQPGNITAYAEFNFRCDPHAAKIILGTSKRFEDSTSGYHARLHALEQNEVASCHVVLMPLDGSEDGTISKKDYEKYIVTLPDTKPLYRLIKAFMRWSFEATADYYGIDYWSVYDAYTVLLALELIDNKQTRKWYSEYFDLTVETQGEYTLGM